jgi:hypothetical protein
VATALQGQEGTRSGGGSRGRRGACMRHDCHVTPFTAQSGHRCCQHTLASAGASPSCIDTALAAVMSHYCLLRRQWCAFPPQMPSQSMILPEKQMPSQPTSRPPPLHTLHTSRVAFPPQTPKQSRTAPFAQGGLSGRQTLEPARRFSRAKRSLATSSDSRIAQTSAPTCEGGREAPHLAPPLAGKSRQPTHDLVEHGVEGSLHADKRPRA